ncbi:MAG: hypothetical protein AUG17_02115 [Crenarchaeota archaeon 13_1_20CM_2_53_14]|nr:MAG: hypothetical protein AUI07_01865 [archaeon 13_2_20CM_2_53_6]OLE59570.1 MAG: hypothetical protein AUG17_02115 [Crenarchaeota archaeon 13_1_20CM_2_53_14]
MAEAPPFQALKDAPKEIRRAATIALVCSSFTRALGILVSTVIIATLPTWVPGLLAYQPFPIALLVLAIGCVIAAGKGSRIRERIASREFEKARGSSLSAAILGFVVAGVIPGILYILLYMRIGSVMVKRRPDDPRTVYLLPHPSEGLFLGRYIGWAAAYLLVLYIGYTQLPAGLRSVSDWLSPVLGVHFNTLMVAVYLIFTNPLTYPPVFQLWVTAGLLGGIIAGGKVGRGFMVGLAVFLSTLGAMGLAALSIFQGLTSGSLSGIPPPPAGFSLVSAATGPVASDLLPLFLQAASPTDPEFIQSMALTLTRNAGLIFAIVTISGRAACLSWQAGIDLVKYVFVGIRRKPTLTANQKISDRPTLKTALLLLTLLPFFAIPNLTTSHPMIQAPTPGPYDQRLGIGLDMLGAPNATLEMTNLDLSSQGLTIDSNYAGAMVAAFIVNNNDSQAFGNGQGQFLQIISQPALITYYNQSAKVTASQSRAVEAQFSQALGVPFTTVFSLPMGQGGSANIYAPNPELSNNDALIRLLSLLPSQSFSSLINPASIQNMKYFAAIGLVPLQIKGATINSLSFYMHIQYPREYYKGGTHQLSLKSLLGFQNNIVADPVANVSLIGISFQPGTILYSPQNPPQTYFYNSTYYLNVTSPQSDFTAAFDYPFAPDIVIQKTITPTTGPVGTVHVVVVTIQNLDNVTVSNLTGSDIEASPPYLQTLQISPSGTQTVQSPIVPPGTRLPPMSYTVTTESSGIYAMSPSTVSFDWAAPNGTTISYTINTDPAQIDSLSGPWIQFTRTFGDFQPYSYLLLVPLLLTPIVETYRLIRRRGQRQREKELLARSSPPPSSAATLSKPPDSGAGAASPPSS